jgi:DNA topoisomerase VI subunit B
LDWPLVVLKELLDNSLDACEEAGVPPEIEVMVDGDGITVSDNGPGIPTKTIDGVLDYSVRVSSREAYMAPDRGAQGNALKTLVAMPFVLSKGEDECNDCQEHDGFGRVDITTGGQRHEIVFCIDPIRQEPKIERSVQLVQNVKTGTIFTLHWPQIASDILSDQRYAFLQLASDFTFLNPHLTLMVDWFGNRTIIKATNRTWAKWLPSEPTSPHWYTQEDFERLLAAYIGHDRERSADRYVRDFIKEFRGLTGSAKQKAVLDSTGMARASLSSLANDRGMDHRAAAKLLTAMKQNSKEVAPSALGAIGKDHLLQRFTEAGCDENTFRYKKMMDLDEGVPVVVETAFALFKNEKTTRRVITGVNWSGAIGNPFRSLGGGYDDGLNLLLAEQMVSHNEPVLFLLHCACARVRYTDRGKTNIEISDREVQR